MSQQKFSANKKFGQHFLKSQKVIDSIVGDNHSETKYCLEIGPGPGVLTKELIKKDFPLKVIEIDTQFISFLSELVGTENVLHSDAMDIELTTKFEQWKWQENIWLVSNLPYNVAAPLMIKFFPIMPIEKMTLMMQKEMALRILPDNPKKPSNPLAIYSHLFFEVHTLCQVPPGAFSPPPKVDSTVLTFIRKEKPLIEIEDFPLMLKFGRGLFGLARKQLKKVLITNLSHPNVDWEKILEKEQIAPTLRSEALDMTQVLALFFSWKEYIS